MLKQIHTFHNLEFTIVNQKLQNRADRQISYNTIKKKCGKDHLSDKNSSRVVSRETFSMWKEIKKKFPGGSVDLSERKRSEKKKRLRRATLPHLEVQYHSRMGA